MLDYTEAARIHGFQATLIEMMYVRAEQRSLHIPKKYKNVDRFWAEFINLDMNGTLTSEGLHIHAEGCLRPAEWIYRTKRIISPVRVSALPTWRSFDKAMANSNFTLTMEDLSNEPT